MSRNFALAAFATVCLFAAQPSLAWAGSNSSYSPLADRAATLGGTPFTVEHADAGSRQPSDPQAEASGALRAGNPLAERAATPGGRPFTAQGDQAAARRVAGELSDRVADEAAGNPLADRAATLGGKPFVVEAYHNEGNFLAVVH